MPTAPVYDWGQAVMTSFAAALALFLGSVPKIMAFLAILIIGWVIAGLLASAFAALLRAVRFGELAYRSGFSGFIQNTGVRTDAPAMLAEVAKWFVRLIVLVVAFDALGLPAVSQVLEQLLLWLPNLVVALAIMVIGGLAANALSSIVRGAIAQGGVGDPELMANISRISVWGFAIVVAVNQLGIATTLVNTLFMGLVGAVALALGLAFGLGGRDTASEIVRDWYRSSLQAAPRMAQAASGPQREMRPPEGVTTAERTAEPAPEDTRVRTNATGTGRRST